MRESELVVQALTERPQDFHETLNHLVDSKTGKEYFVGSGRDFYSICDPVERWSPGEQGRFSKALMDWRLNNN